jgi:hypothetical protein
LPPQRSWLSQARPRLRPALGITWTGTHAGQLSQQTPEEVSKSIGDGINPPGSVSKDFAGNLKDFAGNLQVAVPIKEKGEPRVLQFFSRKESCPFDLPSLPPLQADHDDIN